MHVHVHVLVHVLAHVDIHEHTHTHMHTGTRTQRWPCYSVYFLTDCVTQFVQVQVWVHSARACATNTNQQLHQHQ